MGFQKEYLTMNGLKNLDYIDKRDTDIKILSKDSNVKITNINNHIPYLSFDISKKEDKETLNLELPRLYYLGYKITLTTKNGEKINLNYKNNKYGFIKITVPENGHIEMKYTGTLLYQVFSWIRNITILIFIVVVIKYKYNQKKEKRLSNNL